MNASAPFAFECFDCKNVTPLRGKDDTKCPSCGSAKGQAVSSDQIHE